MTQNTHLLSARLGDIVQLSYGKGIAKSDRNEDGKYTVYGANGELGRADKFLVDGEAIIVGRKGSAGDVTRVSGKFWPTDVTYYALGNERVDIDYLFHLLKSLNLQRFAEGVKPGINRNKVYDLEIFLPPLSEQKRIVKILDEVFEKIEKAKANAERNLQNSRELFESYLEGVFANPSEDWQGQTLKEISLEFGRGKSKHRPRNDKSLYGGAYPFIQTGDVRNANHFISEYTQTYSDKGLAQSKLWPKGTICITIAANIAETGILNFDACFPDSVIGLVVDPKKANVDFVEYLLKFFKTNIQAKGKGSAQANINMATFEFEKFPIPPLSTQKTIVKKLDAISEETKKLEAVYRKKFAALDELKKSVLKKAFAGEL